MGLDRGTVDQNMRGWPASLRQRSEQVRPHALVRPSYEAIVKPRPVVRRRINPATAGLQDVHDPADHAPIINASFASRIGGQMGGDLQKLCIRQPKLVPTYPCSPSGAVNHNYKTAPSPFMGPDPSNDRDDVRDGWR